jgi:serine/threonine-protein kinase
VVCYRALTTRVPFRGETLGALCVNIERGVFAPPSRLRADLPPSVDTWFERAMARQPEARFESVREMTDAFERAIEGHTGIPMPRQSGSSRLEDDAGSPVSAPATGDSMVSPPTFDGTSLSGEIPTPRRSRTMALVVAGAALGGMAIAWVAFRLSTPGAAAVGSSSPVSVMSAASVVTPGVAASVTAMASASASAVPVGSGSAGGVGSAKAREISTAKDTGGTKMPLETTARRPQPTADPTQSPAPTSTHRDRGF